MTINFDIRLTDKQQEAYNILHRDDCQFLIARWSRQCGKTVLAECCLIEYLCKAGTYNAYISPTYSQGRKVYSELITLLEGTGIIKKANASDLMIESVYGSTLKFFTIASPTSIRGYTIDGLLVIDEAAYFPVQLPNGEDPYYNVIFPIVKARKPKVLCISTPCGKQGMFFDLWCKAEAGEKGYYCIKASIYDDQLIRHEDIEELKRNYPPLAWAQEFEVEFLDNALTVFPDFEKRFDIDTYSGGKCYCAIDPSSVGDDNTILTFINEKNEVKQYKIDGALDAKYAQIAKLINKYNPVQTYIESNSIGEVMANEIKKQLLKKSNFKTFATTNESKKNYISLIAVAIANGDIHFEQDNRLLYSELSTYSFKITKTGSITYAAREPFHDDTVSSLGIALQCKEDNKYITKNNINYIISNNGWIH